MSLFYLEKMKIRDTDALKTLPFRMRISCTLFGCTAHIMLTMIFAIVIVFGPGSTPVLLRQILCVIPPDTIGFLSADSTLAQSNRALEREAEGGETLAPLARESEEPECAGAWEERGNDAHGSSPSANGKWYYEAPYFLAQLCEACLLYGKGKESNQHRAQRWFANPRSKTSPSRRERHRRRRRSSNSGKLCVS